MNETEIPPFEKHETACPFEGRLLRTCGTSQLLAWNLADDRCKTEDHEECPRYLTRILTRSRPGIRRSDPCLWSK